MTKKTENTPDTLLNASIKGFSKLTKREKIKFLKETCLKDSHLPQQILESFWHKDEKIQSLLDEFSENTISNFPMPFGVAPNFLINGEIFSIPMVIEESSVVAACSRSAKFWLNKGGFKTKVLGTEKIGQVHFYWDGDSEKLERFFQKNKTALLESTKDITFNMEKRGGGINSLELKDFTAKDAGYFQLYATFSTCDAMGANFINSTLERLASVWSNLIETEEHEFTESEKSVQIVMSILSNYTPNCIVRAEVSCPIKDLADIGEGIGAMEFAQKFRRAIKIANIDPHRATTHNKGVFNGIDAVVLATGNDFRAVEACGHTYAARNGQYQSLTHCAIEGEVFKFWIDLPLAIGTIGGLTALHPLAKLSLDMLGHPSAEKLMEIIATVGLAQNFAAIRSLVTSGIQKGHMKMHLKNILNQFEATEKEVEQTKKYFEEKVVSFNSVREYIEEIRHPQS